MSRLGCLGHAESITNLITRGGGTEETKQVKERVRNGKVKLCMDLTDPQNRTDSMVRASSKKACR